VASLLTPADAHAAAVAQRYLDALAAGAG